MKRKSDVIRLHMLGLPILQDLDDFSDLTHLSKYTLYQLSKYADKHYRTYGLPKKRGKDRIISQPSKRLKGLQAWILANILAPLKVSNSCKGFEVGSSTFKNAEPHRGANGLLTIDLKEFFPTVSQKQVFNIFRALGYNDLMAVVLSNLCTYEGALPQGGPCSPKLANLVAWRLDLRIQGYVGRRGISYTRYADDLSFSSMVPSRIVRIIPMINKIIVEENFKINSSKTRIAGNSRAKVVTGLTLSNDSIGIGKRKYKILRSMIHHLSFPSEAANYALLNKISGWLGYLNSVDKKRSNKIQKYITDLASKHPDTLLSELL